MCRGTLLCSVLRCGTCLVRHVSADRFPRAGGDVPALERRELRVADCAGDLETGTGILPEAMGRSRDSGPGGTHRRASEAYASPELPICVPIPYRKPRTAHARSLQIYREARQTRPDKV